MTTRTALVPMLLAVVVSACTFGGGGDEPAGDGPPDGPALVVDWTDPSVSVTAEGFTIRACEGGGPFLCVERDGAIVGVVEAMRIPLAAYPDSSPDEDLFLQRLAEDYVGTFVADRAAGCPDGYRVEPSATRPATVAGTGGIAFGFAGTMPDGSPSELHVQHAVIDEDDVVVIAAGAYDDGGCPGPDDLGSFDTATLAAFRPVLERILAVSPLPAR